MSELIGTVHKPQPPEVPEPEGWMEFTYNDIDGMWHAVRAPLLSREALEEENVGRLRSAVPRRLVHIGPAPKVPVEAIRAVVACAVEWRHLEEMANRQTPYAQRCVNEVQRWLSAQEDGAK